MQEVDKFLDKVGNSVTVLTHISEDMSKRLCDLLEYPFSPGKVQKYCMLKLLSEVFSRRLAYAELTEWIGKTALLWNRKLRDGKFPERIRLGIKWDKEKLDG